MSELKVLDAAPVFSLRKESVDVPEFGGAVVVRGLKGSEAFALDAIKQQATRRITQEAQEARARGSELDSEDVELTFDEWKAFGSYVAHLLSLAVVGADNQPLYSAEEWDIAAQHHPEVVSRLQRIAERLSGLNAGDVRKNSPSTPD